MAKKYYITTPIYYVNDVPHIGHAYTTIAADTLARYHRLLGEAVFFLTGTDEHGQKVEQAAEEKGRTPQAHADLMAKNFEQLWQKLEISNDAFIRTTDKEHIAVVQTLLRRLYDAGEIERRTYEGWYCTPDERFWAEKELSEGNCPECGRPVDRISEDNYFFLMSKYQGRLIDHIEKNPQYVRPESRRNEVLGFLKSQTLGDLCISRPKSRLRWGVELPFDKEFVTYVWFDALINYFSGTRYLSPPAEGSSDPEKRQQFWWPADHHLVGKDILTTHSVYWSTMLMALGVPLPGSIFAHGWWTREGRKMSKSIGNVIDPHEVVDSYGADAFRYFLLREVPFGLDGDFSPEAFVTRFNTELANDLGNLLSRVQTMISKYFNGSIPLVEPENDLDRDLREIAAALPDTIDADLAGLAFSKYLQDLWTLVSRANRYVEENAPWTLAKKNDMDRLGSVLYNLAESLRLIGLFIYPVMPSTAQKIWDGLGMEKKIVEAGFEQERSWGGLKAGTVIKVGEQLFPRIDREKNSGRELTRINANEAKRTGTEKNSGRELTRMNANEAKRKGTEKTSGRRLTQMNADKPEREQTKKKVEAEKSKKKTSSEEKMGHGSTRIKTDEPKRTEMEKNSGRELTRKNADEGKGTEKTSGRRLTQINADKPKSKGTEKTSSKEKAGRKKNVETEKEPKKTEAKTEPTTGLINIKDFAKVDLRVGKVIAAERVEKSEKLLKLQVDIGEETRQVVAGIGKSYSPEELTGKTVAVVANLKPAKLMGIESQGMLLAASSDDTLAVATFDREMPVGSKIK
ncbi:MAG TPA: methionine--tRNA ligase [Nitrospiraceae bacterium]|nr:methionine--tRNA ligase [Nitrospiraceae bacterium]